jgi:pyrroloquinoline-quinone synthase
MSKRIEAFERFYKWIDPRGLEYFRSRLTQARRDSGEALELTLKYCRTRESQEEAIRALQFKCDLLWAMLDSIHQEVSRNSKRRPARPD